MSNVGRKIHVQLCCGNNDASKTLLKSDKIWSQRIFSNNVK